jgi:hypothetical protein
MRNAQPSGAPYVLEAWNNDTGERGFRGLRRNARSERSGKGRLGIQESNGKAEKREE